jgi:hypothetical protein
MALTYGALSREIGILTSTPHHRGSRHFEEGAGWAPIHPAGEGVCKGALAGSEILVSLGSYTSKSYVEATKTSVASLVSSGTRFEASLA